MIIAAAKRFFIHGSHCSAERYVATAFQRALQPATIGKRNAYISATFQQHIGMLCVLLGYINIPAAGKSDLGIKRIQFFYAYVTAANQVCRYPVADNILEFNIPRPFSSMYILSVSSLP